MIDKSKNNIECESVLVKIKNMTTALESATIGSNLTAASFPDYAVTELERLVCNAEVNSQTLDTQLNVYTAPMGT